MSLRTIQMIPNDDRALIPNEDLCIWISVPDGIEIKPVADYWEVIETDIKAGAAGTDLKIEATA